MKELNREMFVAWGRKGAEITNKKKFAGKTKKQRSDMMKRVRAGLKKI